ncbi:MAG: BatA and WFA domain-containing protein [Anaerolineales bacterium]
MSLLAPLALLFSLLTVPLLLLYMLKLRREDVRVPSTLLWQQALRDLQANTPWQKLRRNLLLLLQLLALIALVLALSRPVMRVPAAANGSLILLLDASASMNATDVSPSRFEAARSAAAELIASLQADASLTLIQVGAQPQTLISTSRDKTALTAALRQAAPQNSRADWRAAFALAAGAASLTPPDQTSIVILSDGGIPADLPPLPVPVRYLPIGSSSQNLAITALSPRAAAQTLQLFVSVRNYGNAPQSAILALYQNAALFSSQQITIPPNQTFNLTLPDLPNATALYEARLSPLPGSDTLDPLTLDDHAYTAYNPGGQRNVLLVTSGNLFLEQILAAVPQINAYRALPDDTGTLQLPDQRFDLYVLDGILPDPLPPGNLLLINPPTSPLLTIGAPFTNTAPAQIQASPLTANLDWSPVYVAQAQRAELPLWAIPLVQSPGGTLVFAGETQNRRIAGLTFNLQDSDLPLRIAFPVLFSHLLDYLAPGRVFDPKITLTPGDSVTLYPQPDVAQVVVVLPNGSAQPLGRDLLGSGIAFNQTQQPGFYTVNLLREGQQSAQADVFAVNPFFPEESAIAPAQMLTIGQSSITPTQEQSYGQREFWGALTAVALALLTLEWWYAHGMPRLSGFSAIPRIQSLIKRKNP